MFDFLKAYIEAWREEREAIRDFQERRAMTPILPELVASIAESKLGLAESPPGSNRGPQIQEFFDSDDYDPNGTRPGDSGYPWCAAFVDRIVDLAMQRATSMGRGLTFKRPTTAAAFGLIDWSLSQDKSTNTRHHPGDDIRRGDIIVFTFSHCAIATGAPNSYGHFTTVEGNTNKAGEREGTMVLAKSRPTSQVLARIRLTV